ncbi:MAG: hypothetical protein KDF60_00660 [Calditrichaeota bacterium]|nr:hypothetical protein [Calditrichota bacterium]
MDKLIQSGPLNARDHYNRQQQDKSGQHENIYYVQADISSLHGKLQKGSVLNARIILCLGSKKYLLRFLGNNYIMQSDLDFKKFDDVQVSVENTEPKLQLKILPKKSPTKHDGLTDIWV